MAASISQTGHVNGGPVSLVSVITDNPHDFLQPAPKLHAAAIGTIKAFLDPLAADIAAQQAARRDENRKKRKRSDLQEEQTVLQLRQIYTDGFGVKQVWEQAKRVLDAACVEVENDIQQFVPLDSDVEHVQGEDELSGEDEDEDIEGLTDEEIEDEVISDEDLMNGDASVLNESGEDDGDKEDLEQEHSDGEFENEKGTKEVFVKDKHGLNDGFFSIDNFNKQSIFLEQQDQRGEDDNPSDEDDIDWDADPSSGAFSVLKQKPSPAGKGQDEDEDDEDGPTFGDVDLDASSEDDEMVDDDEAGGGVMGLNNTNDIRYSEFFEPPAKTPSKTKRMRALPKTQPKSEPQKLLNPDNEDRDEEADMQRAISDVRRDLLESEHEEEDEDESDLDSGSEHGLKTPKNKFKNMSTHEKQRAIIAAEIRRLEAENVSKRDWTLSGEARAVDRPLNSLIEEDLEFERAGKPVPVITAEVTEEIEALIKRRILAREFDEVVRRRPDAANEMRRGRAEVDDSKSAHGLAEVYEAAHLKATDPNYEDKLDKATKKQHDDIRRLWKEASAQLDLLSNLHFKPKRPEIEIKSLHDKPTISMEDARPVGAEEAQSMLAPQEIYRPGEKGNKPTTTGGGSGEVMTKSGAALSREELTREEKTRRRRREKERIKKQNANDPKKAKTSTGQPVVETKNKNAPAKKADQAQILDELKKGNVSVIGKKGELVNLGKGKKGRTAGADDGTRASGGNFKL